MIIRYTITILRYTIFSNVDYVMMEIIIELHNANIKYMIFRYEIDTGDIKYVKIYKISQQRGYLQLEIMVKQFRYSGGAIPA